MPTYEYRCLSCEHQFERFQRMSDEPVRECEACGSQVKRLLFPVAIHFKGSGFYSTDYAKKNTLGTAGTTAASGAGCDGASAAGDGGNGNGSNGGAKSADTSSGAAATAPAAKND